MPTPSSDSPAPVVEPQRLLLSVLSSLPSTAVAVVDLRRVLRFVRGSAREQRGCIPVDVVGRPLAEVRGEQAPIY